MSHHQREQSLCSDAKAVLASSSPGGTHPGPGLQHLVHLTEGTELSEKNSCVSSLASLLMAELKPGETCPLAANNEENQRLTCPKSDAAEAGGRVGQCGKAPSHWGAEVIRQRWSCWHAEAGTGSLPAVSLSLDIKWLIGLMYFGDKRHTDNYIISNPVLKSETRTL